MIELTHAIAANTLKHKTYNMYQNILSPVINRLIREYFGSDDKIRNCILMNAQLSCVNKGQKNETITETENNCENDEVTLIRFRSLITSLDLEDNALKVNECTIKLNEVIEKVLIIHKLIEKDPSHKPYVVLSLPIVDGPFIFIDISVYYNEL